MNRFLRRSTSSRSTARELRQQRFVVHPTVHRHARSGRHSRCSVKCTHSWCPGQCCPGPSWECCPSCRARAARRRGDQGYCRRSCGLGRGRLVSRRLPLGARARTRTGPVRVRDLVVPLVDSLGWSDLFEEAGGKGSESTDSISRQWFSPGMDKETCLQWGVSPCLLSYRTAPHRFTLAWRLAEALSLLGTCQPCSAAALTLVYTVTIRCTQVIHVETLLGNTTLCTFVLPATLSIYVQFVWPARDTPVQEATADVSSNPQLNSQGLIALHWRI